jgi:PEP-CTERM motif-containing protein
LSVRGRGGGGGGGSIAFDVQESELFAGVNSGNGFINITIVPEPSTWAMMLAGFAGLGWLARQRRCKLGPA